MKWERNSHKEKKPLQGSLKFGAATIFWIVIWAIAAALIGNDILVAGPLATIESFIYNAQQASFWYAIVTTTLSIVCTATASTCVGVIFGLLAYRFNLIRILLAPVLQVLKSAPVACVIVIILVMSGAQGALITIVAFVAFPSFYVAAIESQQARNRETEDVLRLAGMSTLRIFFSCIWPTLLPYFITASKTSIALSWRAGITAELLCIPFGSIGEGVYLSKLTLDSAGLLMWTIIVMALSWLNEKIIVSLLRITNKTPLWVISKQRGPAGSSFDNSETSQRIFEVIDLSFAYEENQILENFNLTMSRGERICLMAPTGTGKSTLIDILVGRLNPLRGTALRPSTVGLVFQIGTLIPSLTAEQNIALVCGREAIEKHKMDLECLLPENTLNRASRELSGGTSRLTEIARAVLGINDAVILDEPFAGLDTESKQRACSFILQHLNNRPLLVATHDENDAQLLEATIVRLSAVK